MRNLNYYGIYVHIAWISHFCGLLGHHGLQMTSEVTNDLIFGVSGVINPCSSAFLAPKCFSELNVPEESQISSIDLLASPQVKIDKAV